MDLKLYFTVLKKYFWIIVAASLISASVVYVVGRLSPPLYTANATVRIIFDFGVVDYAVRDDYNTRLLNTYISVLTSNQYLEKAINQLDSKFPRPTISHLRENVVVELIGKTELLKISVSDQTPEVAQALANGLASLLIEYTKEAFTGNSANSSQILAEQVRAIDEEIARDRQKLAAMEVAGIGGQEYDGLKSDIVRKENTYNSFLTRMEMAKLSESFRSNSVSLFEPASLSTSPSNLVGFQQLGIGALIGLLGSIALAIVLENLDCRVRSVEELEQITGLPVIGVVPVDTLPPGCFEVADEESNRQVKEAYRMLASHIRTYSQKLRPLHSLMITSATPKEGKSMVAANLSQALAEQGKDTLLIDCNLRQPALMKVFGLNGTVPKGGNMSETYQGNSEDEKEPYHFLTAQPNLYVLYQDTKSQSVTKALASYEVKQFINSPTIQDPIMLLDTPHILGVSDVSILARQVDGAILVINQQLTNPDTIRKALHRLEVVQVNVIGVVFVQKKIEKYSF